MIRTLRFALGAEVQGFTSYLVSLGSCSDSFANFFSATVVLLVGLIDSILLLYAMMLIDQ